MRGGRIFIIIGVFLGLLTMVAALIILSRPEAPPALSTPTAPKTTKVVVAVQNVGEGTKVVPQAVELREQEINEVPPGALVYVSQALDKIARITINQGQIVQESMLTTEEEIISSGRNASILIPKGRVAIALPLDKLSSVGYALEHGDSVDVLLTMKFIDVDEQSQTELPLVLSGTNCPGCVPTNPQLPRMTTQLLVQDAQVLKVGIWTPSTSQVQPTLQPGQSREATTPTPVPPPDIVTLMVNHQDALVVKYARESGARYDLVLRSSGDHDLVTTEPVTLDYMLARFGIVVPPKRPYTLYSFTAAGKTEATAAASGGGQ